MIVQLCFDLSAEKVDITAVLTVVAADDRGLSRAALGIYLEEMDMLVILEFHILMIELYMVYQNLKELVI